MLDFAVHLGHRLLAAHGQDRVAEPDQDADQADGVRQIGVAQPAQGIGGVNDGGARRQGRQVRAVHVQRVAAPRNHDHDHHRGDVHDAQGLLARLVNALDVLPPEINGDQRGKNRGGEVHGQHQRGVHVIQQLVQEADQIQTRRHAADRPGQNVVKHQRRDGDLRQRAAHRFLHHAVHAAAHEHAAALDVHRAHRVGQAHDGQDEPGPGFPIKCSAIAPA